MDAKLQEWRKNGKHLPEFLKDFHDQKEFFKFLHESTDMSGNSYIKDINFIQGQCYVLDVFLHRLAAHGWTLQRSRAGQNFEDLDTNMKAYTQMRRDSFSRLISPNNTNA